jgi:hypothetical protein
MGRRYQLKTIERLEGEALEEALKQELPVSHSNHYPVVVVEVVGNGMEYKLPAVGLFNPGVFGYGYEGESPRELALAICSDLLEEAPSTLRRLGFRGREHSRCLRAVQPVMLRFVTPLDHGEREHWIDGDEVLAFIKDEVP